jgi:hypothetical protein
MIIKEEGTYINPAVQANFPESSLRGAKSRSNLCIQGDCPRFTRNLQDWKATGEYKGNGRRKQKK